VARKISCDKKNKKVLLLYQRKIFLASEIISVGVYQENIFLGSVNISVGVLV